MNDFATKALPLVFDGIPVFPCSNTKQPLTPKGFHDATTDLVQVAKWSDLWPTALVGVPTGSASGIDVVDLDVKVDADGVVVADGFATMKGLTEQLPPTLTHKTRRGAHHLFKSNGQQLKCTSGTIGSGVDTRGAGGYIIWWPAEGLAAEGDMAPLPEWVVKAAGAVKPAKGKAPTQTLPLPADIDEVLARIDPKGDYAETWVPTVLGTLNTFGEAAVPHLRKWSQPWYAANSWNDARATADINSRIQNTGTATWENVRERAGLPREAVPAGAFQPIPHRNGAAESGGGGVSVQLVKASDVPPENVDWLWKHWLAKGKIHIAAGAPGTGKTTIALNISATVSNGGTFPDGFVCEAGNVLIWSGEDAIADTLVPRLMAAGANMERVFFVNDIGQGDARIPFDPAIHMPQLEIAARILGDVSLLIVDSIADVITGDSHKNAEVRRGLRPLADFGQQTGCAIFGIAHFNKGSGGKDPLERVMGSAAFGAVARVVYGCAKIIENDVLIRRVFARAKSNIGPDGDGFEYSIHMLTMENGIEASRVEFGQPIIGTAKEILSSPDEGGGNPDEGQKMTNAMNFLREILKDGPVDSNVIKAQGKDEFGITMSTMRRAKDKLGIQAHQVGKGIWHWSLLPEFPEVK